MSDKRFYLSHYVNQPDRPVLFADIGNHLKITGCVYQGMGSTVICLSPSGDIESCVEAFTTPGAIQQPSVEEWSEIIRQSDDPEVFIGQVGQINKILHRKQRFEISSHTQQRVWARDGFMCVYCGRQMGDVLLTIDHFVSLENGGSNNTSNYVSACRKDNKAKGAMDPQDFCKQYGYEYEAISNYVKNLKIF